MPGYTQKNLKQVEDLAPKYGMDDTLEAHFARGALECERSGMSYFRYQPNGRTPFGHRHNEQEEIYVLLSGSARAKLDDELVELEPLDALRVPGDVVRAFEAGPDGAEILAFGAGPGGREESEILPGWWSD
jgi:quercetin dioxygenase-like cupin family protein